MHGGAENAIIPREDPRMPGHTGSLVLILGSALVATLLVLRLLISCRVVARPNEALVITGGPSGRRIVVHGGAFIWPVLERVDVVSLGLASVRLPKHQAMALDGVPVRIVATAEVKIDSTEPMIARAAEVFLRKTPSEIEGVAERVLAARLLGLVGRTPSALIVDDPEHLATRVRQDSETDLAALGLKLISFVIVSAEADRAAALREFKGRKSRVFGSALCAMLSRRSPSAEAVPEGSEGIPLRAFGAALQAIAEAAPHLAESIARITTGVQDRLDVNFDELDRWVDALLEGASRGDPDRSRALRGLPTARIQSAVRNAIRRMTPGERLALDKAVSELAASVAAGAPLEFHGTRSALADSAAVRHSLLAATHERLGVPRPLDIGDAFDGRFEVIELLGIGGMGEVYRVRDRRRDKEVALKVLTRALLHDAAAIARFVKEVNHAMELTHPNIVRVHDVGDASGRPYLHMELVEGTTLRARLARGAIPLPEALLIARGFLAGLAHAHERGVLHLDVKPENILLGKNGEVKLADLGLARGIGLDGMRSLLTGAGTPHYMAPEQVRTGGEIDARTDVFAAGVVLYEMLAGEPPIGAFEPLSEAIPEALRLAVQRSLSPRPDRRPADARELLAAVAQT